MKRLLRRIRESPLRAYVISALSLLAFAAIARIFLIPLGVALLFGIGDGYPSAGMKIFGAVVLAITLAGALTLTGAAIISLVLVQADRERSRAFRLRVLAASSLILVVLSFAVWLHGRDDAASTAIIKGNLQKYETAIRWRWGGDLDDDLWLAARWGRLDIVKALVAKGANPTASKYGSILKAARENLGKRPTAIKRLSNFS